MSDEDCQEPEPEELSEDQKREIAKWFLTNAPAGEIQYIAKDIRSVLMDDHVYNLAASDAFPVYNKNHIISLEMPNRSGDFYDDLDPRVNTSKNLAHSFDETTYGFGYDCKIDDYKIVKIIDTRQYVSLFSVLITTFGEISGTEYLDPRTAQVAVVDHVKQVCTDVRPATDEELPSPYIEEFRCDLDAEIIKYVGEAYKKGVCSVYCTNGKDAEGPGSDFEFAVVITAVRHSPQNFCNGSWRSIWNIEFKDELQVVELRGKMQVGAHYFEEGNVQLDASHECRDSTIFQSPYDCAISVANIIRNHETEYLASLEGSYLNLPDTTFKDLRRKLPVTRTLFPWHNTMQISLTRDITKELGIK